MHVFLNKFFFNNLAFLVSGYIKTFCGLKKCRISYFYFLFCLRHLILSSHNLCFSSKLLFLAYCHLINFFCIFFLILLVFMMAYSYALQGVLDGKYDDLPEQSFYMVGGIEEVIAKAEKIAKESAS